MKKVIPTTAFLFVACALSPMVQSQEVFRCGDSYSQKPCTNAVLVNVDDTRSPEQKAQADAVIRRDLATANAMEKARLQEEAQLRERNAKAALAQAKAASRPKTAASAPANDKPSAAAGKGKNKKKPSKAKKEPAHTTASPTDTKPKLPSHSRK